MRRVNRSKRGDALLAARREDCACDGVPPVSATITTARLRREQIVAALGAVDAARPSR